MSEQQNMAMVLQAFKNAGLSDNQARILGAEVGRENSFQDKYLWGYHRDPANNKVNIGIISWQDTRGEGVARALRAAGLIQNGKIVKGQASLDVMAKYLVNEIRTKPEYSQTKKKFLDNPNVDYRTGTRVLDTNFILWRYDDPKYAGGHRNREHFYRKLGGVTPTAGASMSADTTPTQPQTDPILSQQPTQPQFQLSAFQPPQIQPVDLFGGVGSPLMGLNTDLFAVLQAGNPLMPTGYM